MFHSTSPSDFSDSRFLNPLKDLIIDIINESTCYIRTDRKIVNCIKEQIESGLYDITIRLGNSEKGLLGRRLLDRLTVDERHYILKKIISEEYKIDLSGYTLKVME